MESLSVKALADQVAKAHHCAARNSCRRAIGACLSSNFCQVLKVAVEIRLSSGLSRSAELIEVVEGGITDVGARTGLPEGHSGD